MALFRAADFSLLVWKPGATALASMMEYIALVRQRFHGFDPVIVTMGESRSAADLAYQQLRRNVRDQLGGYLSFAAHFHPDNPGHGEQVLADSLSRFGLRQAA